MDGKKKQQSVLSFFRRGASSATSSVLVSEPESEESATDCHDLPSTSSSEKRTHGNENKQEPKKKKKHDSFLEKWLSDFHWLKVDEENTMFCDVCVKTKQKNGYTRGSRNYQYSTLVDHTNTQSHKVAISTANKQPSMVKHSEEASASAKECVKAQLRTVLYMAKNTVPANNFENLIELQRLNGAHSLQSGQTYTHHDSVSQMEECLADVTKDEIKKKIEASDFVGIIIDETLNCTLDKKLIVYVRVENSGRVESLLLGNYTIDNGTAECVFNMLVKVLEEWGIADRKVAGLGSDGASVMTGSITGVGVRLRALQPALIHIHCAAHRVALAAKDATEGVKSVADYRICLAQIFKYYRASGDRTHRLRELCDCLDLSEYRSLKHPISVRWLSLGKAVKAIQSVYPALVIELEEEGQRKNPAGAGLGLKCKMFSFAAITNMLADVIPVMERLNLTFQLESVNLSLIQPVVESTQAALRILLTHPGTNEVAFFTAVRRDELGVFQTIPLTHQAREPDYQQARSDFIEQLIESLTKRFPADHLSVISALATVFDTQRYPPSNPVPGPLDQYGTQELTVLTRHFATVINGPRVQRDFGQFKRTLVGYGRDASFTTSCSLTICNLAVLFPDFSALAKIASVIPVTSVPAERGFSFQNSIKTVGRSRLSEERVTKLIQLKCHGKEMSDFYIDSACGRFLAMKARRK